MNNENDNIKHSQIEKTDEPRDALPIRTKLVSGDNEYTVKKAIKRSSFAFVYEGADEKGNNVFIEELFPNGVVGRLNDKATVCLEGRLEEKGGYFTEYMECFQEKARKLGFLEKDENVIKLKDTFLSNGTQYIITEYLEGKSFLEILKTLPNRRLGIEETIANLMPVIQTLIRMHHVLWKKYGEEKGPKMLFNGISPQNIIFTNDGPVKLMGIENNSLTQIDNSVFASSSRILIPYPYIALEAFQKSKHLGPWSDVYSLAVTIYRAITGENPPEAMRRYTTDRLKLPSTFGIEITSRQEKVLLRGLMVSYSYRYQSIEEFINDLQT